MFVDGILVFALKRRVFGYCCGNEYENVYEKYSYIARCVRVHVYSRCVMDIMIVWEYVENGILLKRTWLQKDHSVGKENIKL